jgi:uncharacterized membrane protein
MLAAWVAMLAAWVAMLAAWVAMLTAWVAMLAAWVAMRLKKAMQGLPISCSEHGGQYRCCRHPTASF